MRRLVLAALLIAVVALSAAGALALRGLARTVETDVAGVTASLGAEAPFKLEGGSTEIALSPAPSVAFQGAALRTTAAAGKLPVAEGGRVLVVPRLGALLRGKHEIERVVLEGVRFVARPDPKQGAQPLFGLIAKSPLPVALRNCTFVIERGTDIPVIEMTDVDLDFTPHDGAVDYAGTLAALGAGSHAEVAGTWRPKAGRTGGDGLKLSFKLRDGAPDALFKLMPWLRPEPFKGPIAFELDADGFLGERTTEVRPAEPLTGTMRAEMDFDLFGLKHPVVFENGFALDDRRLALKDGKGKWGERPLSYSGWIGRGVDDNKINLRLGADDVDVDRLLADYGIDERWRPKGTVSAEVRAANTLMNPLPRYEAKSASAVFDGFRSFSISGGPFTVTGTLLAINAEVAASFMFDKLQVGHLSFARQLVGVRWWRNELALTSLGQKLWDGRVDGAISWKPKESSDVTGGGVFNDVDAAKIVHDVLPDLGMTLTGRMDLASEARYDSRGLTYEGRAGLFVGTLGPDGWIRRAIDQMVAAAGNEDAVSAEIAAAYPMLTTAGIPFDKAETQFQSRDGGINFAITRGHVKGGLISIDTKIERDYEFTGDGLIVLTPDLASALIARAPKLAPLADPSGSLGVPMHIEGSLTDAEVSLDRNFAATLVRASKGEAVEPSSIVAAAPSFTVAMPPLFEQFQR